MPEVYRYLCARFPACGPCLRLFLRADGRQRNRTAGLVPRKSEKRESKLTDDMKIVVLKGSPRKNGNSSWLADQFAKGAAEAAHEVVAFDCARHNVGDCLACNACGMNGPCVQQDDFASLRE